MTAHRRFAAVGIAADALLLVSVFLPWAGVNGDPIQAAGWGSAAEPRLRGMLVLTCAAAGIVALVAVGWFTAGLRRRITALSAALAALVALVPVVSVLVGPGSFTGSSEPASPSPGAWLALVLASAALSAALAAALRSADDPAVAATA